MRIVLLNPGCRAYSTRFGLGVGAQTPLGLLSIGGPLLDDGHRVWLVDADAARLNRDDAVAQALGHDPEAVLIGHGASTPTHLECLASARVLRAARPDLRIVYGGVYPSYHARAILDQEPAIDVVVRGEGEATAQRLLRAWSAGDPLSAVPGVSYRRQADGRVVETPAPPPLAPLDDWRIGWELITDWDRYQCWGRGRAAVVPFSRGCPHTCTYCGQQVFWGRWRYRDPVRVADEVAWLCRTHNVRFVDFADENPAASQRLWQQLLEELAARCVPVALFASLRADDIVRDAALLPLYRRAGMACVLMGVESTDAATLARIGKGSRPSVDRQAIGLLRAHGILSMVGHIVGFEEETWRTHWRTLRQLMTYDPDLVNAMYVTPHDWTAFARESAARLVVQTDLAKWDYRHQVLATRYLRPWQLFGLVKLTELIYHARPKQMARLLWSGEASTRRDLRWCMRNAVIVWLLEILDFFFATRFDEHPQSLQAFVATQRPDGGLGPTWTGPAAAQEAAAD